MEGRYANYFKVGHNAFEFVLDLGQFYPAGGQPQLHTRIITSPVYAKALLDVLRESIDRFEKAFGLIPKGDEKANPHSVMKTVRWLRSRQGPGRGAEAPDRAFGTNRVWTGLAGSSPGGGCER